MNCVTPRIERTAGKTAPSKRPYQLGKRLEQSERKRTAILVAARKQLASKGFLQLTMDGLAQQSRVTRQTVHNLFGTKAELLEALFDQLARAGGMKEMRNVMQERDPRRMLAAFAEVLSAFWSNDRLLLRRIHGIAAIDPEFATVLAARNQRRWMAATRVIERMGLKESEVAKLYALTSFEFFDVLAEVNGEKSAGEVVKEIVHRELEAGGD
jgi:AcrR family transcriptional regulator